ncbi:putative phosphopantetheinyl transferase [Rosellinia necatrix]|uniref:holo-[acyl-carrier-protein] synthase n=1 Tax=Rosellinia necatrix TaxID=77044 RepID=A0A1W2TV79_ROSNE|nr:putative phosphopantetheinyl transferase [Rosellinia necatrix]
MESNSVELIQYLVDTRELWPAAAKTSDLESEASRPLALLTPEERAKVLKYYFVADAKMALASHLLKHWVVSKYAGVPWRETRLSADMNGKPVFRDAAGRQPVVFNVSHQAGLVALVAAHGYDGGDGGDGDGGGGDSSQVHIGVDIVCVSERAHRDHRMIRTDGWAKFVDMHADVFGRSEAAYLKTGLAGLPGYRMLRTEEARRGFQVRAFYTLWCLREAYVKMTGEALLAAWLGDLVFQNFEAPAPGAEFAQRADDDERQIIRNHDILFKGAKADDANVCIRSLGPDYMTCTAVRTPHRKEDALGWDLGPFEFLALDDVVAHAEAAGG